MDLCAIMCGIATKGFIIPETKIVESRHFFNPALVSTAPVVEDARFRAEDGELNVTNMPGTGTTNNASTWSASVLGTGVEQAGHVIHEKFGGTGRMPKDPRFGQYQDDASYLNIVPLTRSANVGTYYRGEKTFMNLVRDQKHPVVCAYVHFWYEDKDRPGRPNKFQWLIVYCDKDSKLWTPVVFPIFSNANPSTVVG